MPEHFGLPDSLQTELAAMRDVLGLLAFAVEARRVLQDVDTVAESMPQVNEALGVIEVRRQWTEYPDTAANVLASMHWRLEELLLGGTAP